MAETDFTNPETWPHAERYLALAQEWAAKKRMDRDDLISLALLAAIADLHADLLRVVDRVEALTEQVNDVAANI